MFFLDLFPDNIVLTSMSSDILSHYKEIKAKEEGTYVLNYAKMHRLTEAEALSSLISRTIFIVERARRILGEGRAREAWEDFASGYIKFHLLTGRYRLADILPEYI